MFGFRHSKEPPYLPREVEPGNIESYIQNRLDDQIIWYDQKAQQAQNTYKRMQFFELIVAAAIPLLANYTVSCPAIAFIVGLLGAIVTVNALAAITKTGLSTVPPAKRSSTRKIFTSWARSPTAPTKPPSSSSCTTSKICFLLRATSGSPQIPQCFPQRRNLSPAPAHRFFQRYPACTDNVLRLRP